MTKKSKGLWHFCVVVWVWGILPLYGIAQNGSEFKPIDPSRALVPVKQKWQEELAELHRELLEEIRERLDATLIGQPEIIERFMKVEMQKAVFGYSTREKPVILGYLMGLSGTGKDTAVESYLKSVWGPEKDWQSHLFRFPVVKKMEDLWKMYGSNTGYVGSTELSPFIRWLVSHSGGRYEIIQEKGVQPYVVDRWAQGLKGEPMPKNSFHPEDAVVFLNEFHNWAKEAKDLLVKQALEKGLFPINNPGKGVNEIYVPINFVIASNEGIDLVTSREMNGERFGRALSYEEMMERWERLHSDKQGLKAALMKTNGMANARGGENARGISEELINRIPESALLLMRPHSPENLRLIVGVKLEEMAKRFRKTDGLIRDLRVSWSENLVKFLQEFHYQAEENARPMEDRVLNLIENTIMDAIFQEKIPPGSKGVHLRLDVVTLEDRTSVLEFRMGKTVFTLPIEATASDRVREPMSEEAIDRAFNLKNSLKKHLFGLDQVIKPLSEAIAVSEEARFGRQSLDHATEPARSFLFLGLSSTGKTETGKAIARELYGSESSLVVINFNQVQSIRDMENKILGSRDGLNQSIASDFMKHYDRKGGNLVVVLDEIANAPREVLKALYDVLREPVVRTFSDGKERAMGNVIFIMTGNAGEEWYRDIPREIPEAEQQLAMEEVYKQTMKDPNYRRRFLEAFFSEALLNRIGEQNIFFFGPLGLRAIREMAHAKVRQAFERMKPKEGRWGWNIGFDSEREYIRLLEVIETEGFILREQGASIDRFVRLELEKNLRTLLLENKIPIGSNVSLELGEIETGLRAGAAKRVNYHVWVEGRPNPLILSLTGKQVATYPGFSKIDQVLTAYHEAGHEIVRELLFNGKYEGERISIIPGVAEIGGRWIRYLGIASYEEKEHFQWTRAAVTQEIAVLAGGYVAQGMAAKNGITDAGKSNDMERATSLARHAILKWGLSDAWGVEAIPSGVTIAQYLPTLSESRRKLLEVETQKFLLEGEALARALLESNFETLLIPMAMELAEKGELGREELRRVYESVEEKIVWDVTEKMEANRLGAFERMKRWFKRSFLKGDRQNTHRDAELREDLPRPKTIADIESLIRTMREKQLAQAKVDGSHIPLVRVSRGSAAPRAIGTGCRVLFL